MVDSFESATRLVKNYSFIKHTSLFGHWSISSIFDSRSFVASFSTKIEFVFFTIIAAILIASKAQDFSTAEFFLNRPGFRLSCFLFMISAVYTWEEISFALTIKSSMQSFPPICIHWDFSSVKIQSSKVSSAHARYREFVPSPLPPNFSHRNNYEKNVK